MANTPNNDIPYAPENVTDPAAANNLALDKIDGPLQLMVLDIQDSPPSESADGDRYIVDTGSGEWSGQDGRIARYIEDGDYWDFFDAHVALNQADGLLYINIGDSNGWTVANRPDPLPAVTGDKTADLTAVVTSMLAALDGVMWDDQTT